MISSAGGPEYRSWRHDPITTPDLSYVGDHSRTVRASISTTRPSACASIDGTPGLRVHVGASQRCDGRRPRDLRSALAVNAAGASSGGSITCVYRYGACGCAHFLP